MSDPQERQPRDDSRRFPQGAVSADLTPGGELVRHFLRAGYKQAEVDILQPVEPFLELSGEDIRRRLFVTTTESGEEMCLRPEFTIPAACAYLAGGIAGRRSDLVFLGPVFRHRSGESGEFTQLSAESIGRKDCEAADADMLAESVAALSGGAEAGRFTIRIGDLALFARLIDALSLNAVWVRRLGLALSEGRIAALLDMASGVGSGTEPRGLSRYSGVVDALKGADPSEAKAFVKDILALAGISAVGGRSAEDIASRFLDRARDTMQPLGAEQAEIIRRFLAISGDVDTVASDIRGLARESGLDLDAAIDRFELRTGFIAARGLPLERITAAAGFARNLDYYSGFCFEIHCADAPKPVAAGGRYDRLFERLGSPVPAVGVAIWLERLAGENVT